MRMHRLRVALLPIVFVSLGACSSPAPAVEDRNGLRVEIVSNRSSYEPGEGLIITIRNRGEDTVYVDPCLTAIEGEMKEDHWSRSFGVGCAYQLSDTTRQIRALPPGEETEDTLAVNARAYRGSWRAHLWFLDADGCPLTRTPSHSNIFPVVSGPMPEEVVAFDWVLSGSDSAAAFLRERQIEHDQWGVAGTSCEIPQDGGTRR